MARGRTRFEAALEKARAVKAADDNGLLADGKAVRTDLMERVASGAISLEQAQSELRAVKAKARRSGQKTRAKAWSEG